MSRTIQQLTEQMQSDSQLVAQALGEYLPRTGDPGLDMTYEPIRYSIFSGGKRVRPFLTLEFCRVCGGSTEAALPFACAIEALHTYSLIHDDMECLDNGEMRRGIPATHKKFGEVAALLSGDALQAAAFGIAAGNEKVSAEATVRAVRLLAESAGPRGMAGGQMLDYDATLHAPDYDRLVRINSLKTGCFIDASCRLGCIAAGADSATEKAASEYAKALGLCFQLVDDILDSGDENEGVTFMKYMSEREARDYAAKLTAEAKAAISGLPGSDMLLLFADYLLDRKF